MIITKDYEKGHKKTVLNTNIDEIKQFLKFIKNKYNTSASYREYPDRIEIKINGHQPIEKIINEKEVQNG